jgi:hypothetical protein
LDEERRPVAGQDGARWLGMMRIPEGGHHKARDILSNGLLHVAIGSRPA